MPDQPDTSPTSTVSPVWSVEEVGDVLYVVRSGVWPAMVRISPTKRPDPRERAREVCDALNRLAG